MFFECIFVSIFQFILLFDFVFWSFFIPKNDFSLWHILYRFLDIPFPTFRTLHGLLPEMAMAIVVRGSFFSQGRCLVPRLDP